MSFEIIIMGDICLDSSYTNWRCFNKTEMIFHDILPLMKNADYVIANLEAPATFNNQKLNKNSINLKSDPNILRLMTDCGIRAFSLANNHILDYGMEGLEDTIRHLKNCGIDYYGIAEKDNRSRPLFIKEKGIVIGIMAFAEQEFNCAVDYGQGACKWDDIDSILAIREAKDECDYLIIQYHGGIENYVYPSPMLQKKCRAMVEAGANFVTCQHSHIIGSKEEWKNASILYGQGNTIFGFSKSDDNWNCGLVCGITIKKEKGHIVDNITYIPIIATNQGEYLAKGDKKNSILNQFKSNSSRLNDLDFIREQWTSFCRKQSDVYLPMLFGWKLNMIRANRLAKGILVNMLVSKNQKKNIMNLLRCDAHREVIETILEDEHYKNNG